MNFRFLSVFILVIACATSVVSQEPVFELRAKETPRGIELYQQGNYVEAIKVLREAVDHVNNDFRARHYLAMALEKSGDNSSAREEHEKAALLGERILNALLDRTGTDELNYNLRTFGVQLAEAAENAGRYIELSSQLSRSEKSLWKSRHEALLSFAELAQSPPGIPPLFKGNQVDVRPRILSKPEPIYTEEARRDRVSGTVILGMVLAANGKVLGIHSLKSLPDGLTNSAITAARGIKFEPGTKDGKPVSVLVRVEYNFYVY